MDRETLQDVSQARKIPGSGFGQRHSAGVAACACADLRGFQDNHSLIVAHGSSQDAVESPENPPPTIVKSASAGMAADVG